MRHLPMFAAIALLGACTQEEPAQFPASEVTGVASDSYIVDGTVKVFPVNGGKYIASTGTDTEGNYQINEFRAPAGHYRIIAEGGYYIEESSGQMVRLDAGEQLSALFYHEPGTPVSTMITPETSLATGLALCLVDRDNLLLSNAVRNAGSQLSSMYDVSVNTTRPSIITDPANATSTITSAIKYGFIQAGRSELVQGINEENGLSGHEHYTSMDFSMLSNRDIRDDCQLNGQAKSKTTGATESLSMGVVEIGTNTYRTELPKGMLRAANSSYNRTGLDADDLLLLAHQISTNTESVYGGESYQGVDADGPTIIWESLENNILNGLETLRIKATDAVGMGESQLFISGELVGSKQESGWMEWIIDTRSYREGPHLLEMVSYDSIGNQTIQPRTLVFDNSGPDIDILSSQYSNTDSYRLSGTVDDAYSPLVSGDCQPTCPINRV